MYAIACLLWTKSIKGSREYKQLEEIEEKRYALSLQPRICQEEDKDRIQGNSKEEEKETTL